MGVSTVMKKIKTCRRKFRCISFNLFHNKLNFSAIPTLVRGGVNNTRFTDCEFLVYDKSCSIYIGGNCFLSGTRFFMNGCNSSIVIGNGVSIIASKQQPTYLNACEGKKIIIGNDCLLSNNVEIHTTDYHSVMCKGVRTNDSDDVFIGEHCWIGLRTVILKGSVIPSNNVIGCCSLISRKFLENNAIIAGVPARIVRCDVNWNK